MNLGSAPGTHEKPFWVLIDTSWMCSSHGLCLQYWFFWALSALSAAHDTFVMSLLQAAAPLGYSWSCPHVCRQLFKEPHPPRLACPPPPDPATLLPSSSTSANSTAGTALSLALLTTIVTATASEQPQTSASAEVYAHLLNC